MERIKVLPKWVLPDTLPSVYDTQSGTCIEMTAKVYAAMRELQTDYNKFIDELNPAISEFIEGTNDEYECFKAKITKICHDYISMVDIKITNQDRVLAEAVSYMKENLVTSLHDLLVEMSENGELNEVILSALTSVEENLQEMINRISTVEGNITTINNSIDELNTKNTNLEERIGLTESKNSELQNRLDLMETVEFSYEYNSETEELIFGSADSEV